MNFYQKYQRSPVILASVILLTLFWVGNKHLFNAYAQENQTLVLSLSRDFGYSSGTGSIQGTFSMRVSAEIDLLKVVFFIDNLAIGEDTQPPFQFQFNTDNYGLGEHTIHAVGYAVDGKEYASKEIRADFVSSDEGWQTALKIIIPVFGLILGAMLISFALPWILRGGKPKQIILPDHFSILGGAVCPKCKLPFNIPFLKINLVTGSLLPCPYCGKWSIVRRASSAHLQAALEAAKIQQNPDISKTQSENSIKKEIDDSRYIDL